MLTTRVRTMPDVPEAIPAGRVRALRMCTIAYTFYQSDGRVMRYNKALAARGATVDVIALREHAGPRIAYADGVRVTGIQTRTVNERSPLSYLMRLLLFFLRASVLLSWRHMRYRYDIIHIHSVPDFLVFSAWLPKLMGAKLILDIHDLLPELYVSKFGLTQRSLVFAVLQLLERLSVAFADHVITANDLWHEKLVNRTGARGKATALLNFPDRSIFRPRGRTRKDDKFIMIYPGSLNWHQGLDIAIEAFAAIKDRAPEAEFHIYGSGPALPELRSLARKYGLETRVLFREILSLQEIARVIENADAGVVPKRKNAFGNEAFSTKIFEFMALGVPVIVSDTKIDAHYFDDSLVKFFRGGSADHLAECMLELIHSAKARESLRSNGLRYIESNGWDIKQELYLDLVSALLPVASSRR